MKRITHLYVNILKLIAYLPNVGGSNKILTFAVQDLVGFYYHGMFPRLICMQWAVLCEGYCIENTAKDRLDCATCCRPSLMFYCK